MNRIKFSNGDKVTAKREITLRNGNTIAKGTAGKVFGKSNDGETIAVQFEGYEGGMSVACNALKLSTQKPQRGRPRDPSRPARRAARRFYPLEKTPETIELMNTASEAYEYRTGKKCSDAELLREALRIYIERGS